METCLRDRQFLKMRKLSDLCKKRIQYHTSECDKIEKQYPLIWVFKKDWNYHWRKWDYYIKQWRTITDEWNILINDLKQETELMKG